RWRRWTRRQSRPSTTSGRYRSSVRRSCSVSEPPASSSADRAQARQPKRTPMAYSIARSDAAGPRAVAPGSPAELAIVAALIILALYYGQAVLVPFALAIILSFALAPAVRLLRRMGLPNAPAVVVVVAVAFGAICTLGALVTQQIGHLAQEIP